MKVLPAILIALIGLPCTASADLRIKQEEVDRAFHDACRLNPQYDCRGLLPPIGYSRDMPTWLFGRYAGGNVIAVASWLNRDERHVILTHEAVHYLQYQVGGYTYPTLNQATICKTEAEAWRTSNKIGAAKGYQPDHRLMDYGPLDQYGCGEPKPPPMILIFE